jgi:hypothetical protein
METGGSLPHLCLGEDSPFWVVVGWFLLVPPIRKGIFSLTVKKKISIGYR